MKPTYFRRAAAISLGLFILGACAPAQNSMEPKTGRIAAGWGCPQFNDFRDLETASKAKDVKRVAHMTGIFGQAPKCHFVRGLRYTPDVMLKDYARVRVEFPDGTIRLLWVLKKQLGGRFG